MPVALPERTFRDLRNAGSKTREWTERRDDLIRQAYSGGGGVREIARAVGLTHPAVLRIVNKGTSLVPPEIAEHIERRLRGQRDVPPTS
jgi:DNA invertase Pin-like site-specific DNA recombinase